ncbi:MAG: FtsX-like permease family protein [Blastocatellia bacterium]
MRFEYRLVLRSLLSRRRGLVRFTAIVAVIGIAAGVSCLILAQTFARGFQSEMQSKILANTPHISVFANENGPINDWESLVDKIALIENVESVTPTASEPAVIVGGKTSDYAQLQVFGSDLTSDSIEIAVGAELARRTGAVVGNTAEIVTFADGQPKNTQVTVIGEFQTGIFDYDASWVRISAGGYAKLRESASFNPTVLSVKVSDIYRSDKVANYIRERLGTDYRVIDWQEANRPLFAALSLEQKVSFFIIVLITLIAVVNITTTLLLLVNERRLDIAVLRTCGAKSSSIVTMLAVEGLALGIFGIALGIITGLTACFAANYYKLIQLDAKIYSISGIALKPEPLEILVIAIAAFALCVCATFFPALKASGIKPMENLRNQ